MAFLHKNDRLVASVPLTRLAHWLHENGENPDDYEIRLTPEEKKAAVRQSITSKAGDELSILGTTADATQLLFHSFSVLVSRLHTAENLAQVRAAAAPFTELAAEFLARVERGEVKLPFQAKGVKNVVTDIEKRATAVAEALESANQGEK